VQPAGRARVLKEKQKNVHAYVVGKFHDVNFEQAQYMPRGYKFAQAFYNPYKVETFVNAALRGRAGGLQKGCGWFDEHLLRMINHILKFFRLTFKQN
jgi:hypothetical protein